MFTRLTVQESYFLVVSVRDYLYFNPYLEMSQTEANLPHWRQDSVTYFVTFRLADSVPQSKLSVWKLERDRWLSENPKPHDDRQSAEYYELFSARIERWLDAGEGGCALRNPKCARIVEGALRYFDGERYELRAWCIMPNHVHVLIKPNAGLGKIVQSWKSYTGRWALANNAELGLGVPGKAFWQREYWDRFIRDQNHFLKVIEYIHMNPVKAKLVKRPEDWKWSNYLKHNLSN